MGKKNACMLSLCLLLNLIVVYPNKKPPTPNRGRPVIPPGLEKKLPVNGIIPFLIVTGVVFGYFELTEKD